MKKSIFTFCILLAATALAFAGPERPYGKETKQVAPAPCPEWYADNEWNVDLFGTHTFTGNDWLDDEYFEGDHGWGGGGDVKYFFMRYFGVGVEGWVVDAKRHFDIDDDRDFFFPEGAIQDKHRAIGAVLGTFTIRYPIHCSRFAPYIFAGGGAIFGGGEEHLFDVDDGDVVRDNGETRAIGQFGGGLEIRFTRHIGWMSDFSWNIVDGDNSDFGMVRTGLNFAF
jgi:hypothetical protein